MAKSRTKKRMPTPPAVALERYVPGGHIQETSFEKFLHLLYERIQGQTSSAGAIRWTTFPLEYALASGFWPIMIFIARELKRRLETPTEVAFVATKVNQLMCASILAVFPKVEFMVDRFEENVVQLLDRAIALGYRPGMKISLAVWRQLREGDEAIFAAEIERANAQGFSGDAHLLFQAPVALFFMDIIKVARQKYEKWMAEYKRLVRLNSFSQEMFVTWAEVGDEVRLVKLGLEFFDLSLDFELRSFLGNDQEYLAQVNVILDMDALLKKLAEQISTARKLPVNEIVLKRRMELDLYYQESLDFCWLHSQLLIAAGELPKREWILTTEFAPALAALKRLNAEELIDRTLGRWQKERGFSPTGEDLKSIRALLAYRIVRMKMWTTKMHNVAVPDIDWTIYQMPANWSRP